MSHIEKCRNVWYATLKIPPELHEKLGRTKFKQTTRTTDKRKAQELAKPLVAFWKAQIRGAYGEPDAVQTEALRWREALAAIRDADDHEQTGTLESVLLDRAEAIEGTKGEEAAQQFAAVALGTHTPSSLHFDEWAASVVHLEAKTQDQMKKDVGVLIKRFQNLEQITPQAVRKWVNELTSRPAAPASASSVKRMVSFWRSYWRFLVKVEAVPPGSEPFALIELPAVSRKEAATKGWTPFPHEAVASLINAARAKGDSELVDLITLGAYTGARIEELCALKLADIGSTSFRIIDSKTVAGVRETPIHRALEPLLERLRAASKDGYLLSGLTFNKYGDRSNAIGKRFGRLKTALGFGRSHVFHSLRKTLVTALENAGVSENLAADIVGHEKPRITYGLYSGGASLEVKAQALAKVSYPAS